MNWKQPKVYAVKHKDEATRAASKSGGVFTALSDQVLSNDGVVYGCILTDDFVQYILELIIWNNVIKCEVQNTFRVNWRIPLKY